MVKAYTYLIGWTERRKFYYGVRYAKGCDPSELWISYFTSSKYVQSFHEKFGNPDLIEIRQIFDDRDKAIKWESKVLKRMNVIHREDFLNQTDNKAIVFKPTKKWKEKISKAASKRVGSKNAFFGKSHSIQTKQKISETKKLEKIKCQKCGKITNIGNYNRWHGENCGNYQSSGTEKMLKANGLIFNSLNEAAKHFGVSNGTITYRVKSKNFDYDIIQERV